MSTNLPPHHPFGQSANAFQTGASEPQRSSGMKIGLWVLAIFGGVIFLCCGVGMIGAMYIGMKSPETSVYAGNQIPNRFLETATEVGALEPGEKVRFFYSDALLEIRNGFYFVSDRSVVVYIEDGRDEPLTKLTFGQIKDIGIIRDTSFLEDSQILLTTVDDEVIAFPVSSEFDRDQKFFDAIEEKTAK